jgi:hypothetical protein
MFVLHHAGSDIRNSYTILRNLACSRATRVQWDKREPAQRRRRARIDHPGCRECLRNRSISPRLTAAASVLAQDAGTGLLGDSFGLFARQTPHGIVLATHMLDEKAILAINPRC